jgi:hypothetical protein
MRAAGIAVAETPAVIGETLVSLLKQRQHARPRKSSAPRAKHGKSARKPAKKKPARRK